MNLQNFETVFFKKQALLFAALERQKKLYKFYLNELTKINGVSFDQKYNFDFNLLYDLRDRLECRMKDLQSKYYDLHWQKYNFNAY